MQVNTSCQAALTKLAHRTILAHTQKAAQIFGVFLNLCPWFLIRKAIEEFLNIHATYSYFVFKVKKLRQPTKGTDSC